MKSIHSGLLKRGYTLIDRIGNKLPHVMREPTLTKYKEQRNTQISNHNHEPYTQAHSRENIHG